VAVPIGPRPVGWYTGSPTPGQRGPSVIAAHVTWNGARGAFWALGQMRPGQRITIRRADAKTVTFEVTRVAVYQKSSFPTSVVYGNTADPELRLITCAGDYHPGTAEPYAANVVVYAEAVARSS
jgi:sortase (surface protein transpeptidase)